MNGEIIKTNIEGLIIRLNKVVKDERGALCEIAPKGFEDELFSAGIRNIYASIPTKKGIARGGHNHFHQIENLYTLSGTLLWVFADVRETSLTKGEVFAVIVGWKKPDDAKGFPVYTIDDGRFAQIYLQPGIYHIFAPLTDEKTIVIDASSTPYDRSDYGYPELSTLPKVKEILDKFGVRQI